MIAYQQRREGSRRWAALGLAGAVLGSLMAFGPGAVASHDDCSVSVAYDRPSENTWTNDPDIVFEWHTAAGCVANPGYRVVQSWDGASATLCVGSLSCSLEPGAMPDGVYSIEVRRCNQTIFGCSFAGQPPADVSPEIGVDTVDPSVTVLSTSSADADLPVVGPVHFGAFEVTVEVDDDASGANSVTLLANGLVVDSAQGEGTHTLTYSGPGPADLEVRADDRAGNTVIVPLGSATVLGL